MNDLPNVNLEATKPTARPLTPKDFTLAIVEGVVARHPGVTVEDVFGPCRKKHIILARFEAIAEIVEARPHWSYPTVGRLFNRDHTTILSALDRIGKRQPRTGWNYHEGALQAVRSVSNFIQNFEAAADQKEYLAAMSVAEFVRSFALPAWARPADLRPQTGEAAQ